MCKCVEFVPLRAWEMHFFQQESFVYLFVTMAAECFSIWHRDHPGCSHQDPTPKQTFGTITTIGAIFTSNAVTIATT
jgi:hypothetical protein